MSLIDKTTARNKIVALLVALLIPLTCLAQTADPTETIRVKSDLVDLKICVVSLTLGTPYRSWSRWIFWCSGQQGYYARAVAN